EYRQLLSVERLFEQGACSLAPCELRSQLGRWRYSLDRISSSFRSFKKNITPFPSRSDAPSSLYS
ncbi:MAG: hypothetical protein K1W00_06100, partial [Lachnospiraceae bacterium]